MPRPQVAAGEDLRTIGAKANEPISEAIPVLQGHPIVSPDAIRLAITGERYVPQAERLVWATAHAMKDALFLAGHETVIIDATNNTVKRRDDWRGDYDLEVKYINTPENVCRSRAIDAGDAAILAVIGRMADAHEPPAVP